MFLYMAGSHVFYNFDDTLIAWEFVVGIVGWVFIVMRSGPDYYVLPYSVLGRCRD